METRDLWLEVCNEQVKRMDEEVQELKRSERCEV
jgi:hypothetical protein